MGAPVGTADSKEDDREGDGEVGALGEVDDRSDGMLVGTEDGDRDSEDAALGTDDGSSVGMLVGTKDGDRDTEDAALGEDDDSSVGMFVGTEEGVGDGLPLPITVPASDGVVVGAED